MYTTFYPTNIVSRTALPVYIDDVDDVEAKVVNDPITELVATQTELGALPSGSTADLTTRLAVSLNDDGSLKTTLSPTFVDLTLSGKIVHTTATTHYMETFANSAKTGWQWDDTWGQLYLNFGGTHSAMFDASWNWFYGQMVAEGGIKVGGNNSNAELDDSTNGDGSDALYIGNQIILVENGSYTLGALNIGGASNYCEIKTNGELALHGTARVTRHLFITPTGVKMPAANFPSIGLVGLFPTLDFDDGGANESANATSFCPFRWDSTTDITVSFSWTYEGDQDDGFVVWGLEYRGIKTGEAVSTAGTDITQKSAGSHTTGEVVITTFTTKLLASNLEADDDLGFRIYRNSSDTTNDTLAVDAKLINVHLHFIIDKLGEPTT